MWIYIGIYVNLIVRVCAHRWVCSYMDIVLHILQSQIRTQTITHAHTHTHTHAQTHMHTRKHVHTHKQTLIHIHTDCIFLACFLYCKDSNLYCTRAVPLYLFFVFLSVSMLTFFVRVFDLYAFRFSLLNTFCTCAILL